MHPLHRSLAPIALSLLLTLAPARAQDATEIDPSRPPEPLVWGTPRVGKHYDPEIELLRQENPEAVEELFREETELKAKVATYDYHVRAHASYEARQEILAERSRRIDHIQKKLNGESTAATAAAAPARGERLRRVAASLTGLLILVAFGAGIWYHRRRSSTLQY